MRLLAIETATEALSVAVQDGDAVFAHHEVAPRRHGELLLPTIERLLGEAGVTLNGLDAIAFGRGPGAFTGVRIAIAAAQGLAFASSVPVLPVSTLACLAQTAANTTGERSILAAIDARMGEIYAGWFRVETGCVTPAADEWLGPVDALPEPGGGPWYPAGTGTANPMLPQAEAMLVLAARAFTAGGAQAPDTVQPVYLRDKVTTVIKL